MTVLLHVPDNVTVSVAVFASGASITYRRVRADSAVVPASATAAPSDTPSKVIALTVAECELFTMTTRCEQDAGVVIENELLVPAEAMLCPELPRISATQTP